MEENKKEEPKIIEFNGMVDSLKRLSELTYFLNSLRYSILISSGENLKNNLVQYSATLESYYLEIIGELSSTEMDDIEKDCLEPVRILTNFQSLTKTRILNTLSPAEKILRLAAKKHGFITRNIVRDEYKTMS